MAEFIQLDLDFTGFSFALDKYREGEKAILTPQLQKLGYEVLGWYDGERDSFGPLSRVAHLKKDGQISKFCYG